MNSDWVKLLTAARLGRAETVKDLIASGISVNASRNRRVTPLMKAVMGDHKECLKVLINAGAELDAVDSGGQTAVIMAVKFGLLEILKIMIDFKADLNISDDLGNTAVMYAVRSGDIDCLMVLIKAGAQRDRANELGQTALMESVYRKSLKFLEALVEAGVNLNLHDKQGKTALMRAAENGAIEHLKRLLRAGANTEMVGSFGETALMLAVQKNKPECALALIEAGANVNAAMDCGTTCLMEAAIQENWFLMEKLISAGACIDAQDSLGKTVLMHLTQNPHVHNVSTPCHRLFTELIDCYPVDLNLQDHSGMTAFMHAVQSAHVCSWDPKCIDMLTDYGAQINHVDKNGRNALIIAAQESNYICVRLLLKSKISVKSTDSKGRTALMIALQKRDSTSARLLLEATQDINVTDNEDNTVLMYAIMAYQSRDDPIQKMITSLVLSKEVNMNAQNKIGLSALMMAAFNPVCDTRVLELLVSNGANIHLVDNYKGTALIYAMASHARRLYGLLKVNWLLEHGANPYIGIHKYSLMHALTDSNDDKDAKWPLTWKHVNKLIKEGKDNVLRTVVINGMVPCGRLPERVWSITIVNDGSGVPPFLYALVYDRIDIAKYLFANFYLTEFEVNYRRSEFLELFMGKNQIEFLREVFAEPWPLVKLAFMAVSVCLGPSPQREQRVRGTGLPVRLQKMLLFQDPMTHLCVHLWEDIPLPAASHCGEQCSIARPLLYYWPFCARHFPRCKRKQCFYPATDETDKEIKEETLSDTSLPDIAWTKID